MTVSELIEQLSKCNPESMVFMDVSTSADCSEVVVIEDEPESNSVYLSDYDG